MAPQAVNLDDLNISAQDHQQLFCCEQDAGKEDYESKLNKCQKRALNMQPAACSYVAGVARARQRSTD